MQKLQKTLVWSVIASESMHVFCCVLPTLFSLISLLAGFGLIGVMPAGLTRIHDALHAWELPMIGLSALILATGWGLYYYSQKMDCHDDGCGHGPCAPKKNRVAFVLKAATILFIVNISVYGIFHRGLGLNMPRDEIIHTRLK